MIDKLLNLKELNKDTDHDYSFTFSKIEGVHLQSPSLIKFKNSDDRKVHFNKLEKILQNNSYIEKAELNDAGFINLTLNIEEVLKYIQKSKSELLNLIKDENPKKYIFDYGGPNIGKSMHVGHLRPLNIGRALYNMYKISGNVCVSDIHLGDWGIPISQILTYCYENNIVINSLKAKDLQKIYPEASKKFSDDKDFKSKVNNNLMLLNIKDSQLINDWKLVSEITLNDIRKILLKLEHNFDLFYGESSVVDLIPEMIQTLKEQNLVKIDDGALISNENTDPPVLILKSDGTYLYMTTDLATVIDREKNIKPDGYFYIVDRRQSDHFKQLFSSVKYFNFSKSNLEHIGFGTINDSEGRPFKTRQGDVYPLQSLFDDIYEILKKKNTKNNAQLLSNSVLTFSDLVIDRQSNYKFDVNKFTNTEGKTAIYIQYTQVRMNSVLNNVKQNKYIEKFENTDLADSEVNLVLSILKFTEVFNRSKNLREPHHLAEYLFELCQKFNTFYKDVRIIDDSNIGIQNRRVNVLMVTLKIVEIIFEVLGIKAVSKM